MLVLHGDDYVNSRNQLQRLRETAQTKSQEILVLDGQKVQLTQVQQAIESLSLFGQDRLVIIENIFGGQKSARQSEIIDYLTQNNPPIVVIWENKSLTPATLKKLATAKVQEFKPRTVIFDFLGALRPRNQKQILSLYQEVLASDPVELIFFLITKQMRQLLTAAADSQVLVGPSWLTGKVISQAKLFTLDHLVELYNGLYEIDKGLKTGSSPIPLEIALELWLNTI